MTEETRRKNSESHKGKPSSRKGATWSPELREKLVMKHRSEETRKRHAEATKKYCLEHPRVKEYINLSKLFRQPKGWSLSEERKKQLSESTKKMWAEDADFRQRVVEASRGKIVSQETRGKMSESAKRRFQNMDESERIRLSNLHKDRPAWNKGRHTGTSWNKGKHHKEETKRKLAEINRGKHWTELSKQKMSNTMKHLWQIGKMIGMTGKHRTEDSIRKWLKSSHTKPNKAELKLNEILQETIPNNYSLNVIGDLLILGGKIPDFVNVNGEKKIIELWGDYWHRGQNPNDRIDYFAKYGWQTLIVWENELRQPEALREKLLRFAGDGG